MAASALGKDVREYFTGIINFKRLNKSHKKIEHNNDLIYTTDIHGLAEQEMDNGEKQSWKTVGEGNAKKSAMAWAGTFRIYNALQLIKDSNMVVLDVGCDVAFLRKMIHTGTFHSGTKYIGIDIRKEVLQQASNLLPHCNTPAVYIMQDIQQGFSFMKSDSVDVLVAMEIFEHVHEEDSQKVLEEFKRVLKVGGKIYLTMPNFHESQWYVPPKFKKSHGKIPYHHKEWKIKDFSKLAKKAGLKLERVAGWYSDSRRLKAVLSKEHRDLFNKLVPIMGNVLPAQIIGHLYPEVAGSVSYYLTKEG